MSEFEVRGVPHCLEKDGWWLAGDSVEDGPSELRRPGVKTRVQPESLVALLALVLLSDNLFWGHPVGLSLAIFGVAMALIIWLSSKRGFTCSEVVIGASLIGMSVLPVIEHVQLLSVLFLVVGMTAFTAWAALSDKNNLQSFLNGMLNFAALFPAFSLLEAGAITKEITRGKDAVAGWRKMKMAWGLPVLVGLVFVTLLVAANPIVQSWIDAIFMSHRKPGPAVSRLIFWGVLAAAIWPFLAVRRLYQRLSDPVAIPQPSWMDLSFPGINPTSISNSLVVFNLILAVQTGLDVVYLWSGFELPVNLTHAEYAHRGAYPLVATALLAGLFAMISRPFTEGNEVLQLLLALWILQNFVLVISSLYRLELYVAEYGLTYLRISAAIWMGLVASGLALTGWQLWEGASNGWLLQKNVIVLVTVLFACCFVNFPHVIAATNLAQFENGNRDQNLDEYYLCQLGSTAAGAIGDYNKDKNVVLCEWKNFEQVLENDGWRDWGFRNWRVRGYLSATEKG